MAEEEKELSGLLFQPNVPELAAIKTRCHELCRQFSALAEDDPVRNELLQKILGALGDNSFIQRPAMFHYGVHTSIGKGTFINFNLTVQDDGPVSIGDFCNFGPNVTIVTPCHPMLPEERRVMHDSSGREVRLCYAKPVTVGNNVWLGANVVICPGVTIGDGCVIGAGSVVTRDIPPMHFAAGIPAASSGRLPKRIPWPWSRSCWENTASEHEFIIGCF